MAASRMIARRGLVCVLIMALIAGLVPIFPEASHALAEEPEMELELDGAKRVSALEVVEPGIVPESADDSVPEGNSRLLAQDLQAENTESEDPGRALVQEHGREESEIPNGIGLAVQSSTSTVNNPRVVADSSIESGQVVTWDCIWFGSYPQTEVLSTDSAYVSLQSAQWDSNGDALVNGMRYRRVSRSDARSDADGWDGLSYRYFRYEPVKWRVLDVEDGVLFVVSDAALDCRVYHTNYFSGDNWASSTVRSWLNGYDGTYNNRRISYTNRSFIGTAFSESERNAIMKSNLTNIDGWISDYTSSDTVDGLFFLSKQETGGAEAARYGFVNNETRCCEATDYACALGASTHIDAEKRSCQWWLRSMGDGSYHVNMCVSNLGAVGYHNGSYVDDSEAVRPALKLDDLAFNALCAGTVSSDGTVNEVDFDDAESLVNPESKADEYIIERVKAYTSPSQVHSPWLRDSWSYLNIISVSGEEYLRQVFPFMPSVRARAIVDPLEGIKYSRFVGTENDAYEYLITNECFLAYNWEDYLCNTTKGRFARGLLYAEGLIFNQEIYAYNQINVENQNSPGVKKYKDVLKKFMESDTSGDGSDGALEEAKIVSDIMNNLIALNEVEGVGLANMDAIAQRVSNSTVIKEIEDCEREFAKAISKDAVSKYGAVRLDGEMFSDATGVAGSFVSFMNATWEDVVWMIDAERDNAKYKKYSRFLEHIQGDVSLPEDLRTAAASLLSDMTGHQKRVLTILGNAVEAGTEYFLTNEKLLEGALIGAGIIEAGVSATTTAALASAFSTLSLAAFISNLVVDSGDFVKQAAYTLAYAQLGASYANKLKEDESAFTASQSAEDAWQFFEDYTMLWRLRYKGEEQYRDMHKIKVFLVAKVPCLWYDWKFLAVSGNLKNLEAWRFYIPSDLVVPESVQYEQKAVLRCPVDVDVYAPDGTLVAAMADGVESDVTNAHGRFVVTYDSLAEEWVKVACFNSVDDYGIVAKGNDLGTMNVQVAHRGDDNVYSLDNVSVGPGSSLRIGASTVVNSVSVAVDVDGDGDSESMYTVRANDPDKERKRVETLRLNKDAIELPENGSELISATVGPDDASYQQVYWLSLDETVATVVGGKVEAVGPGETKVICVSQDDTDVAAECAVKVEGVETPAFRTQSLTLGGAIGVNFYVDLSPLTEEERESCRMSFSVCGREVEDSYDPDHVNAKGYYGFTCPISSVEMADEIAATLSWGDDKSVGKVYSVSEYFEAFEEHAGSLEPEMVALVRSLADYGHYVQPMLARTRGWEVGGDHAEISALNEWDGSEADEAEEASAVHEVSCGLPDGCGVSLVTQSLVLDSGTDLCLYVTTEDGASVTSAKLSDGTALSVEAVPDGRWRVTVPAIMAHELGRRWRVEIETSVGAAADVEASALSWVRAALTADAWRNDAVGRDAAASILRYAQAAEAYKALHP